MLELDHLLLRFLELGYPQLDRAAQADFVRLLESQDQDLQRWVLGREEPPDPTLAELVRRIVAVAGHYRGG
jgi:antitoxin CptB